MKLLNLFVLLCAVSSILQAQAPLPTPPTLPTTTANDDAASNDPVTIEIMANKGHVKWHYLIAGRCNAALRFCAILNGRSKVVSIDVIGEAGWELTAVIIEGSALGMIFKRPSP